MPNVSVTIVGGTQQENTVAATVGSQRWGTNGDKWGTGLQVPAGQQTLTVYKNSDPKKLTQSVQVSAGGNAFQVTVDQNSITVA